MFQCRDQPTWIDGQQRFRLLIWINLDVLVCYAFELERDPDTLNKRTGLGSVKVREDVMVECTKSSCHKV